ncbi:hypothetical protein ACFWIO_15645, partial [Streptomyces diastatochromogenes]
MRDSDPPPLAPGARPAPGYEVLAHLTRTGWLDVYDAWSEERACRCVIKLVRPDRLDEGPLRERLLREGRWLREFTHPHLVRAYETFESPEPLVVLETLTGETLSHLIDRLPRGGGGAAPGGRGGGGGWGGGDPTRHRPGGRGRQTPHP